jgi:hypothetical protein
MGGTQVFYLGNAYSLRITEMIISGNARVNYTKFNASQYCSMSRFFYA